jgi:riboflavin synthase
MFTGIIEKKGRLLQIERGIDCVSFTIDTGFSDLALGESVSVNGVCLTVTETNHQGHALFFVSPETVARTNLGSLKTESITNLERALAANARLSGHIVQGHVDGVGRFTRVLRDDRSYQTWFEVPADISRYCVAKGSICINGTSLTINDLRGRADEPAEVAITIIPHTWTHTNLSSLAPGDAVNIEVDVLAKYVERLMECRT